VEVRGVGSAFAMPVPAKVDKTAAEKWREGLDEMLFAWLIGCCAFFALMWIASGDFWTAVVCAVVANINFFFNGAVFAPVWSLYETARVSEHPYRPHIILSFVLSWAVFLLDCGYTVWKMNRCAPNPHTTQCVTNEFLCYNCGEVDTHALQIELLSSAVVVATVICSLTLKTDQDLNMLVVFLFVLSVLEYLLGTSRKCAALCYSSFAIIALSSMRGMLALASETMDKLQDDKAGTPGASGKSSDKNQNPSLSCRLAPSMWQPNAIMQCMLTLQFINMSAVLDHIFFGQAMQLNINADEDCFKLCLLGLCLGIDLLVCNMMYDVKHVIGSISSDNHLAQLSIVYFTLNAMLGELASKLKPREQVTSEGASKMDSATNDFVNAGIETATQVEDQANEFLSQAVVWMFIVFTMIKTFRRIVRILMNASNEASDFAWVNMNILSACSNKIVTVSSIVLRIVQLLAIRCDEMLVVGTIVLALCTVLNYHHIVYVPTHISQCDPEKQINMAWRRQVLPAETVLHWFRRSCDWLKALFWREISLTVQALTASGILLVFFVLVVSAYQNWEDLAKKLYFCVLVILQMIGPFILMSYFMFHEELDSVFLKVIVSASGRYYTQLFPVLSWMSVPLQNYMKQKNRLTRSAAGKQGKKSEESVVGIPRDVPDNVNLHQAVTIAKSIGTLAMFTKACKSTDTMLVQCQNNGTRSSCTVYTLNSPSATLQTKIEGLQPAQIWFCVTLSLNFCGLSIGMQTAEDMLIVINNNVRSSENRGVITAEEAQSLSEHANAMLTNRVLRNGSDKSNAFEPLVELSSIEGLTTARLDELWILLQDNDEDTVNSLMSLWAPYNHGARMLHKDFCARFELFLLGTDDGADEEHDDDA
tara:strand:- start:2597 stop:5221 length:2625 start_codon:yes stop_codon:yes gene_type:complete